MNKFLLRPRISLPRTLKRIHRIRKPVEALLKNPRLHQQRWNVAGGLAALPDVSPPLRSSGEYLAAEIIRRPNKGLSIDVPSVLPTGQLMAVALNLADVVGNSL